MTIPMTVHLWFNNSKVHDSSGAVLLMLFSWCCSSDAVSLVLFSWCVHIMLFCWHCHNKFIF